MTFIMGSVVVYINIYAMILIFTPILISGITYYNKDVDLDKTKHDAVYSDGLHNFIQDLGEEGYSIYTTDSESGAGIYRLFKPNIYIVPEHTDPREATQESKAVIAHEFSHMKSRDNLMITMTGNIMTFSFVLVSTLTSSIIGVLLISIISSFTIPILLNYMHHRSEYRADEFASDMVGTRAVQNRLRRNTHLQVSNYDYVPYSETHPDIESRMDKINKNNTVTVTQD